MEPEREPEREPEPVPEAWEYDVFLSFRGPDTRQNFTDVLCYLMKKEGIRVFRDDDELEIGDEIQTILRAIKNSRICVPVFSETFASSKWCLREVRMMAKLNKVVAPIFFKVKPDDVKLKTPAYKESMAEHRKQCGEKKVAKWEDALKSVARVKGMELLKNTSYIEFCEEFIRRILMKLGQREVFDVDNVIGLENQLESVLKLLDLESADVRFIGIYGMGGIGKTTLAKVVYNKCSASFDCCSFIDDIRESWERHGLDYLVKKLEDSLDPKSKGGSNFLKKLKENFRGKKVLMVLDDVDRHEQVEKLGGKACWFGPGSRIILTSRNTNILTKCETLHEEDIWHFQMGMLEDGHALQLFSRRAFRKDSPPDDFMTLSKEAISTCGGLPLALGVVGSLLRNERKEVWKDVIAKSKEIPVQEVKEKLKISYNKLEHHQQQIFLDIACFCICTNKSKACYMWEACKLFPEYGLAVLKSLSLIDIRGDQIWMHDQLCDLGKDIVRSENVHPRKRSRLWEHDEALHVIMSKKQRKEDVQALCIDRCCEVSLTRKELSSFENLRFFQLEEAKFQGDLGRLLPELKWLSWRSRSRFKATNLRVPNLLILDLSNSSITENWRGWSLLQSAKKLRALDLSRCLKLERTPCFPEDMMLERLILEGCKSLVAIDSTIGNLKCLTHLDLQGCKKLCGLPKEISSLVKLNTLSMNRCYLVKKLPRSSVGQLKSLVDFDMFLCGITKLPESIGELVKLEQLDLSFSKVSKLPFNIGTLEWLVFLNLMGTKIVELPSSIGGLVKLERLSLRGCKEFRILSDSIGELRSLVELNLASTGISELPRSVGRLGKLERLNLRECSSIQALPHSIGDLKCLIWLDMSMTAIKELPDSIGGVDKLTEILVEGCSSLIELPNEITRLSCLKVLKADHSSISKLPSSFRKLRLLEELHLKDCDQLRELPKLPTSLMSFHVSSNSLQIRKVPLLSKLVNLQNLSLPNITSLPASFSSLSQLKTLELDCRNLKNPSEFPSDLTKLSLNHVNSVTNLPCLSNLRRLDNLSFYKWSDNDGFECLGLEDLKSLPAISLDECSVNLMVGLRRLNNLRTLLINRYMMISQLHFSGLKNLTTLNLWKCEMVTRITGLGSLRRLQRLLIRHCNSLKRLGNLSDLSELKHLQLDTCGALKCIRGLGKLRSLQILDIGNCNSLEGLENMSELRDLKELCVIDCEGLTGFQGVNSSRLERFYFGPSDDFFELIAMEDGVIL